VQAKDSGGRVKRAARRPANLARRRVDTTDVMVDVCAGHGTWFDKGELGRVVSTLIPLPPPTIDARDIEAMHSSTPPAQPLRKSTWEQAFDAARAAPEQEDQQLANQKLVRDVSDLLRWLLQST
jgi:hypothetical protein